MTASRRAHLRSPVLACLSHRSRGREFRNFSRGKKASFKTGCTYMVQFKWFGIRSKTMFSPASRAQLFQYFTGMLWVILKTCTWNSEAILRAAARDRRPRRQICPSHFLAQCFEWHPQTSRKDLHKDFNEIVAMKFAQGQCNMRSEHVPQFYAA